ncbi:hypothetical protein ACTPOK_29470 [Streptomyces inhibens]|uniref:hypothetical protein n=1 Tax=Streptomyces inhibens TaxID=2293571 RepID=UPI00402ABDE2
MVDILTPLMGVLIHEFVSRGVDALFRDRARASVDVVTLPDAQPPVAHGRVQLVAPGALRPYWVLVGITNRVGTTHCIPVLYGEYLDVTVSRGEYELGAMFLSKSAGFDEKPRLMALGETYDVIASGGLQSLKIFGRYPSDAEIVEMRAQAPASGLNFILPPTTADIARARQNFRLTGAGQRPALARTIRPGSPTASPRLRATPSSSQLGKVKIAFCGATHTRGVRCQTVVQSGRQICFLHRWMIAKGKSVFWFDSGRRILPEEIRRLPG